MSIAWLNVIANEVVSVLQALGLLAGISTGESCVWKGRHTQGRGGGGGGRYEDQQGGKSGGKRRKRKRKYKSGVGGLGGEGVGKRDRGEGDLILILDSENVIKVLLLQPFLV